MTKNITYLDYNSTTPVKYGVRVAISEIMSTPHNASSIHSLGRDSKKLLDNARDKIRKVAGAKDAEIIFTSSGTEANNLAIRGFRRADSVVVSAVEHASVLKPVEFRSAGIIPVNENGIIELSVLKQILKNSRGRSLVSIIYANNETGVVQPIDAIAELVKECGGFIHTDAAQAFGKIPVNFDALNLDMMTISAHKFGGPQGAAALIIRDGVELDPIITGGGQEYGKRAGTENVYSVVGFAAACDLITEAKPDMRDYLESKIKDIAPDVMIVGKDSRRLPNTSCITMKGMSSEVQLINFDLAGIAVSSGSACSSGRVDESHVLQAMGLDREIAKTAIRVSTGDTTTIEDIDKFIRLWKENYNKANDNIEAA